MCKSYRQPAYDERCSIKALKSRGISLREIADQLGRSLATISLEIARNSDRRGYRHRQGQEKAAARHGEASGVPRKQWHSV